MLFSNLLFIKIGSVAEGEVDGLWYITKSEVSDAIHCEHSTLLTNVQNLTTKIAPELEYIPPP